MPAGVDGVYRVAQLYAVCYVRPKAFYAVRCVRPKALYADLTPAKIKIVEGAAI